jgi:hypothetical protein
MKLWNAAIFYPDIHTDLCVHEVKAHYLSEIMRKNIFVHLKLLQKYIKIKNKNKKENPLQILNLFLQFQISPFNEKNSSKI